MIVIGRRECKSERVLDPVHVPWAEMDPVLCLITIATLSILNPSLSRHVETTIGMLVFEILVFGMLVFEMFSFSPLLLSLFFLLRKDSWNDYAFYSPICVESIRWGCFHEYHTIWGNHQLDIWHNLLYRWYHFVVECNQILNCLYSWSIRRMLNLDGHSFIHTWLCRLIIDWIQCIRLGSNISRWWQTSYWLWWYHRCSYVQHEDDRQHESYICEREFSRYCCSVIHHHFVVMNSSSWEERERSSCLRSIFRVLPFTTWSYQALSSTSSLSLSRSLLYNSLFLTPLDVLSYLNYQPSLPLTTLSDRSCNPSSKICRDFHPNHGERYTWTHVRFERTGLHLQKARRNRESFQSPKNPCSYIIHLKTDCRLIELEKSGAKEKLRMSHSSFTLLQLSTNCGFYEVGGKGIIKSLLLLLSHIHSIVTLM